MKYAMARESQYDEFEDSKQLRKKPKHSANRPGQGMRILNEFEYEGDDDSYDYDDGYETNSDFTKNFVKKSSGPLYK